MYDAVVIGAGPGGYVAAVKLAQHGKRVAVVEKSFVGGTCTNWGCIPTKALLTSAHLLRNIIEKGAELGVLAENVSFDFSKMKNHMNKVVMASRKGIEYLFKKNKIELINGEAIVESPNSVKVQDRKIEAKHLVIATGSVPTLFPPFNEIVGIWTSDDVFRMERLPESVLIVGGGVIGVELATFFSSLNVKVIIVELLDHILPNEDADAAQLVAKTLKRRGVEIYESSKVTSVQPIENGYRSIIETKEGQLEKTTEKVVVAVGRRPKIGEDLKAVGLAIEKGIKTDETMLTNLPNVYAVGDVRAGSCSPTWPCTKQWLRPKTSVENQRRWTIQRCRVSYSASQKWRAWSQGERRRSFDGKNLFVPTDGQRTCQDHARKGRFCQVHSRREDGKDPRCDHRGTVRDRTHNGGHGRRQERLNCRATREDHPSASDAE